METCFPRFAAFAAWQFLACAYFASLVNRSLLAALTALYLLRENLYLFPLSDFAKQKTKVTQEFFENDEGVPPSPKAMAGQGRGRRKNHIKRRVERQKSFFFSPCNKSVIFYNTAKTVTAHASDSCMRSRVTQPHLNSLSFL